MTYCVAVRVDEGLVLASDSRTNAGVDYISTYSKMHRFLGDGERVFTILSAGNLATTQAVINKVRHDLEEEAPVSLQSVRRITEAAEYLGNISRQQQKKNKEAFQDASLNVGASFILGGEIAGQPHSIFLIYPQGNFIPVSRHSPFFQIGEEKYGKPILDRIIAPKLSLEVAARCALVSMDSTMRSNASVGPPIDLLLYPAGSLRAGSEISFGEDDPYLRALRRAWQESLKTAFDKLPTLPVPAPAVRLVDA